MLFALACLMPLTALSACGPQRGNLQGPGDFDPPPAPEVRHPLHRADMRPGDAPATWAPVGQDPSGTLVRPRDPAVERGRPAWEQRRGAVGAPDGLRGLF
jgi:hypothetical protein